MTSPYRTPADQAVSPSLVLRALESIRVDRGSVTVKLSVEPDPSIAGNVVTLRMTGQQAQHIGLALDRASSTEEDMREP